MTEIIKECNCDNKLSCPLRDIKDQFETMNIDELILFAKGKVVPENCQNKKNIIARARKMVKTRLKI